MEGAMGDVGRRMGELGDASMANSYSANAFPADEQTYVSINIGYIAQWLERLTADQQVPGSNPGVPYQHPWVALQEL